MAVDEISVEKYLQGIVTINSTLGRLDVLRLHLTQNNDKVSVDVIETVMKDLAKVCGVDYKFIDVANVNIEKVVKTVSINKVEDERQYNNYVDFSNCNPKKPTVVEIIENNNHVYEDEIEKNNIANATLNTEKVSRELKKRVEKKINQSKGVEIDKTTGNLTYKFVNSNTLDFMTYNKNTKELIMCFLKNGRTYLYKNVPMYIFDNLHITDENGASAGSYFQQNVVKKWVKNYKEITDTQLIG